MTKLKPLNRSKIRDMNFELLRIISMIMVVALHYLGHGDALNQNIPYGPNWIFSWTIETFSFVAVNCYILISGYFLTKSKFNFKKLVQIWLQILFYSISIYLTLLGIGLINFSIKDLAKSCLPVLLDQYWFATLYIVMYILSPFFNIAIHALDKKQMRNLLIVLFTILSVWPTILPFGVSLDKTGGYSIIQFAFLYFIASYIRLHLNINIKKSFFMKLYFLITSLVIASKIILTLIGFNSLSNVFYKYNSIPIILSSIALFMFFKSISINNATINKIIGSISKLTFGVYLIHDNSFLRVLLYKNLLHTDLFWNTSIFIPISIASILGVFIVCILIEAVRSSIFLAVKSIKGFNNLKLYINNVLLKLSNI